VSADGLLLRGRAGRGRPPRGHGRQPARPAAASATGRPAPPSRSSARRRPSCSLASSGHGSGPKGLKLDLRDGPDLIFGSATRVRAKWAAAARVLADSSAAGATYLDLRVPERTAAGGVGPIEPDATAVPAPGAPEATQETAPGTPQP
jgi:cell division protein FtsQ